MEPFKAGYLGSGFIGLSPDLSGPGQMLFLCVLNLLIKLFFSKSTHTMNQVSIAITYLLHFFKLGFLNLWHEGCRH